MFLEGHYSETAEEFWHTWAGSTEVTTASHKIGVKQRLRTHTRTHTQIPPPSRPTKAGNALMHL